MFEGTEQILWCDSGLRTGTVYHRIRLAVCMCECVRRALAIRVDRLQINSLILGLPFIIYPFTFTSISKLLISCSHDSIYTVYQTQQRERERERVLGCE